MAKNAGKIDIEIRKGTGNLTSALRYFEWIAGKGLVNSSLILPATR